VLVVLYPKFSGGAIADVGRERGDGGEVLEHFKRWWMIIRGCNG